MEKKGTAAMFCAVLFIFFALILAFEDQTLSRQERRTLHTFPPVGIEGILSGAWEKKLELWLPDQFPGRELFRNGALSLRISVLGAKDYQGVYKAGGYLNKIVYPLSEQTCRRFGRRVGQLANTYFPESRVYLSVIPEKGSLQGAESGRPQLDFARLIALAMEAVEGTVTYLPIDGLLSPEDFYRTDIHWRQERLLPIARALCRGMGTNLPDTDYVVGGEAAFLGSYFSSWPNMQPDTLRYLKSVYTESALVSYYGDASKTGVYQPSMLTGMDAYDVFLSGPMPLITAENTCPVPAAKGRTLVLLRDSFGSAIAPLLLPGYERVVVADLRYMDPSLLSDTVQADGETDVLFLYCMESVNTGGGLR